MIKQSPGTKPTVKPHWISRKKKALSILFILSRSYSDGPPVVLLIARLDDLAARLGNVFFELSLPIKVVIAVEGPRLVATKIRTCRLHHPWDDDVLLIAFIPATTTCFLL